LNYCYFPPSLLGVGNFSIHSHKFLHKAGLNNVIIIRFIMLFGQSALFLFTSLT